MRCVRAETMRAWMTALVLVGCQTSSGDDMNADTGESSGDASSDTSDDASSEGSSGEPTSWPSFDERECPDDSILTWENFGGPYVLSYCTTCHHSGLPADQRQLAPVGINLENVELVRMQADRVWLRGADQNATMPPVGALAADDRALLGEWLACGAPTQADLDAP